MLQIFRIGIVSIIFAFLCSCVTTSLSSYTDPAFTGATYESIAIWADTSDLEWRQDLETGMQERVVTNTGAKAIRMMDIAPPTRDYDFTEMFQLMRGADTDAVIVVELTDTGVAQAVSGNEYGVYTSDMPWAEATVALYEVESGTKVWTGTVKTQGDEFTDWGAVRRSAGNKVIEDLLANGLLPPLIQNTDCLIKGNIKSSGDHVYYVPGRRGYGGARIDETKGERWFCSESEAEAAGWQAAKG